MYNIKDPSFVDLHLIHLFLFVCCCCRRHRLRRHCCRFMQLSRKKARSIINLFLFCLIYCRTILYLTFLYVASLIISFQLHCSWLCCVLCYQLDPPFHSIRESPINWKQSFDVFDQLNSSRVMIIDQSNRIRIPLLYSSIIVV